MIIHQTHDVSERPLTIGLRFSIKQFYFCNINNGNCFSNDCTSNKIEINQRYVLLSAYLDLKEILNSIKFLRFRRVNGNAIVDDLMSFKLGRKQELLPTFFASVRFYSFVNFPVRTQKI